MMPSTTTAPWEGAARPGRSDPRSNDKFGYAYGPSRERITVPFSVGPITIQPGDYTNRSHEVTIDNNPADSPREALATA